MDPRKQRIALSLFKTAADLAQAIDRLEAAGSLRAGMTVIAATERARTIVIAGLTVSPRAHLSEFASALSPQAAAALGGALDRGAVILIVPLKDMETEQTASRLLLETPALSVQLHDLGP